MERDLRLISKQRADKDRANGIITEPSPLKETQETLPSNAASEADPMLVDTSAEYAEESRPATDDASDPTIKVLTETVRAAPESTNRDAVTNDQDVLQDFDNSMGLAITIPSDDMTKAAEQPKSPEGDIEAADLNEAPSEIPDNIDLDFESMFNDTDPKDLEELKNIDFDTSIDPAVAEDIIKNLADLPATASEDIDSLLPGVESYLNADTNFSNTTMPPATTIPETSQPTASSTAEAPAQTGEEQAMADTSFDDNFFGLGDFEMGETGGDELGDGTLGDFEDFDWS